MNSRLSLPYRKQEVERAIKEMFPTKAPGPNGFPSLLYQKFWNIVGPKTIASCLEVLNNKSSIQGWNETTIVLIPKKSDPKTGD